MIIKSKEQIEQMTSLSVEQKKKLCTYLGRAQGRNKDYVIECDGDSADSLLEWWQQHQQKAAARSAKRTSRQTRQNSTAERQQKSVAEECFAVISELANVRDKSVKDAVKMLKEQVDEVRRMESVKAETEAKKAAEKINAFKAQHFEIITQYEALQEELQKQQQRSEKLQMQVTVCSKKQQRNKKVETFELY